MIKETDHGWLLECSAGTGIFARSRSVSGVGQDVSLSSPSRNDVLREIACSSGFARDGRIAGMTQVHGSDAVVVDADLEDYLPECDALLSASPHVALSGITADCVPLVVFGEGACSVIHAGWRGLAGGVIDHVIRELADLSGQDPAFFTAFVGPAAGACCYEVGDEVLESIGDTAVFENGHLASADTAVRQLLSSGVSEIESVDVCTICAAPSVLNSFRRDGESAGRQGVLAWLNS